MGFEVVNGDLWFREDLYTDTALSVKVKEKIIETQSQLNGKKLQDIVIVDTERYGRMLILDGIFQTTEKDEFFYHEMLCHFSMFTHPNPKRILVIGGGDGGILKQIVKHDVDRIDFVEIDKEVVDLCVKHMPKISGGAFNDPRLHKYFEDGKIFIERTKKEGVKYDVIIVDSPDPIGPAVSLFTREFYLDIEGVLSDDGIVVRQTGSSFLQEDDMPSNYRQSKEIFDDLAVFTSNVPTYQGGEFTFLAASNKKGVFNFNKEELEKRYNESGIKTHYYSPEKHIASAKLPRYIENHLSKAYYGEELVLDLSGCNQETIKSEEKWREFVANLCDNVLKMKRYGDTVVKNFGHGKAKTSGLTVVQLIETSSIVAHISNYWGYVCLNIFTCAAFDPKETIKFAKEFFGAESVKAVFIKRGEFLEKGIDITNLTDKDL
ncbi:polyamine aminopropyltransferase [Candidatus Aenigmatarchaeota archaeon]